MSKHIEIKKYLKINSFDLKLYKKGWKNAVTIKRTFRYDVNWYIYNSKTIDFEIFFHFDMFWHYLILCFIFVIISNDIALYAYAWSILFNKEKTINCIKIDCSFYLLEESIIIFCLRVNNGTLSNVFFDSRMSPFLKYVLYLNSF